jgi:AhpD family alkylhydroperoxidase
MRQSENRSGKLTRLPAIDPATAAGSTKQIFDGVQSRLGVVPNMVRVMANSPAMLRGYLGLAGALDAGSLGAELREQIALTVAEANGCDYCLAAHAALGRSAGLTDFETDRRYRAGGAEATGQLMGEDQS